MSDEEDMIRFQMAQLDNSRDGFGMSDSDHIKYFKLEKRLDELGAKAKKEIDAIQSAKLAREREYLWQDGQRGGARLRK
jgi:hypothetical protein